MKLWQSTTAKEKALPARTNVGRKHEETRDHRELAMRSAVAAQAPYSQLSLFGPPAWSNQTVLRTLSLARPTIQTKLTINQPGDQYEQEADRVADQVMRMPEPSAGTEVTFARGNTTLQRQCACGGSGEGGGMCAECAEKMQRSAAGSASVSEAPPIVHDVLRSPGHPLDPDTRAFFEKRFGANFSSVRTHTDASAAESAKATKAHAYTVGNHIAFAANSYAPHTQAGKKLLAHELTHVVQQQPGQQALPVMRQSTSNPTPATPGASNPTAPSQGFTAFPSAPEPNDPCQAAHCTPAQIQTAAGDLARAIGYVNAAIVALSVSPLASATVRALDWFFVGHDPATADAVRRRLGCIRDCLIDTQDNNRIGCDPNDPSLGYVRVGSTPVCTQARVPVCLTNLHFGTGDSERAHTVIHECAHRVGMSLGAPASVEDIYEFKGRFPELNTADALRNSDSFATFAVSLTEGGPLSLSGGFSLSAGVAETAGGATWVARFGTDLEFQHPRLSFVNPNLGLGLTLIGNPTTPGHGTSGSMPSLLTSLVAGVRIGSSRGPAAPYVSLFGGPALAIGASSVGLGAEAGVALGYRWHWLDVSAGAGYDYDPTRIGASQHILSERLTFSIDLSRF